MTKIRKGVEADLPEVLELIKELALYEKAADQVETTVDQMTKDGFGPNALFGFFVVEEEAKVIGAAIYYWRYSTWKGRRLYLEDLIITESHRGQGLGEQLFSTLIDFGKSEYASGMMWQVLDWNDPAINFYKKLNADLDNEWINCSIDFH